MKHPRTKTGKPQGQPARAPSSTPVPAGYYWLYGWHAVHAALGNPARRIARLVCTLSSERDLPNLPKALKPEIRDSKEITALAGSDAVHQGIAALVAPLPTLELFELLALETNSGSPRTLLILDHITDPHNVGAMLRSAAAFNVAAIITTKDHGAHESAVMAKAACGALDKVPLIEVTNLASAMREIKAAGYWIYGLDGRAERALHAHSISGACALVMGAEGSGMRRLTADHCDVLIKLAMDARMESLNVSNAAAIALYHLYVSSIEASTT